MTVVHSLDATYGPNRCKHSTSTQSYRCVDCAHPVAKWDDDAYYASVADKNRRYDAFLRTLADEFWESDSVTYEEAVHIFVYAFLDYKPYIKHPSVLTVDFMLHSALSWPATADKFKREISSDRTRLIEETEAMMAIYALPLDTKLLLPNLFAPD